MNIYTLALFAHISGAIGFFIGIGLWATVLASLRRARRVEEIRTLTELIERSTAITVFSILVLLAAGIFMAAMVWGFATSWIDVALGSIAVIAPVSRGIIEPRLRAIARLAREAADGPLPPALAARIQSPVLGTALFALIPLLFGIVFLMAVKPLLVISLATMATALIVGLAACVPLWLAPRSAMRKPDY